jgi:hypothetical protein
MKELKLTNKQKATVTINTKNAVGDPVTVDGIPTWTVTSGDSTVIVSSDGLSAEIISSDTPGATTILVSADADLGSGIETLQDHIKVFVVGDKATNLGLTTSKFSPK